MDMRGKIAAAGLAVFFNLFISGIRVNLAYSEDKVSNRHPVLVVGDNEGLISLTDTPYLDGKPVIFFSQGYQTKNPLRLLEMARTVVFQDGGMQDMLMDLFPSNGYNNQDQDKGREYRFTVSDKPVNITIPKEEKYLLFARVKKDSRDKRVFVQLDDEGLVLTDAGRWRRGEALLSRGKHSFIANDVVEEMVIIPQDEYWDYYRYMKKILAEKSLAYLLPKEGNENSHSIISDGR